MMLPTLIFAMGCAAVMGFAIQRGSTCLVAAIDELLTARRAARLLAIAETAVWVAGGLLILRLTGNLVAVPQTNTTTEWAIAGGALFGVGACINGACAFGTIARLGSGQWAYLFTPLGILIGYVALDHLRQMMAAIPGPGRDIVLSGWMLVPVIALVGWRAIAIGGSVSPRPIIARPSTAHLATIVIGLTFLAMFLTSGPWTYTDILAELASGRGNPGDSRWILAIALLAGAVFAGWQSNLLRQSLPSLGAAARCLIGGAMMGWGSALIPGGNDGLLLIGMPLLRPFAWLAAASMAATILAVLILAKRTGTEPS